MTDLQWYSLICRFVAVIHLLDKLPYAGIAGDLLLVGLGWDRLEVYSLYASCGHLPYMLLTRPLARA
jgi:hypothetical protein